MPTVTIEQEKHKGLSVRTTWYAEVTDFHALCLAVYEGSAAPDCLIPNQKYLDERARGNRELMNIPGVVARSKSSTDVRTG